MNEKIVLKAYELNKELTNDERYINVVRFEKEMEEDEEVIKLSYKKDVANANYNDTLRHFSEDSKEAKKAQKELYLAKKELEEHPKVKRYLKALQELRMLLDEVNNILFKDLNLDLCKK